MLDASTPTRGTSATPDFQMSGTVLSLTGFALPTELLYRVTGGATPRDGKLSVDAVGVWSGSVPLTAGDNLVELSVAGGIGEVSLTVTHNPGYEFGGFLAMTPDVVYALEPRELTALIALPDDDTNGNAVFLVDTSSGSEAQVAQLTDDGNLANGDEIQGDRIYTARFSAVPVETGFERYRVVVQRLSTSDSARSEVLPILVSEHLDASTFANILNKQSDFQAAIEDAVAQGTVQQTLDDVFSFVQNDDDVVDSGRTESGRGIWVVYRGGIGGVLYEPDADVKQGGGSARGGRTSSAPPAGPGISFYRSYRSRVSTAKALSGSAVDGNVVGSNKALAIAAQYFDWGENDDIPVMADILENDSCFDLDYIAYGQRGSGSVEDFKALDGYGVVLISSHGDSFYNGLLSLWQDVFGWNGPFGQVVVHSNMAATEQSRQVYEDDLKSGRLVLWGGDFGMTPSFFSHYVGSMPNSLVYMSICRGTWNGTLASALRGRGAGAFLGYDDYVSVQFCKETGPPLLQTMLMPDKTLADAFTAGQVDPYGGDAAVFKLFGDDTLSLEVSGVLDGDFESGNIQQAWVPAGDARVLPALGAAQPTSGSLMAIVSTGLGFTTDSGSMSQVVCLPAEADRIRFDWNFFSEEFLEWVGSQYQDSFRVTLTDADDSSVSVTLLSETVDSLASSVVHVDNYFDQGDVYATGWRTQITEIPQALRGRRVRLTFLASDVGDSIYDTAVLIDDVRVLSPDQ
ncbi:MAG: choice-of-anchor L domain-containing protein [Planctomycetota bacterium]